MKLRGGGCGSSKIASDTSTPSQVTVSLPQGLATQIKIHSQRIAKKVVTVLDEESNLMNSFQFFQMNARFIWQLAKNEKQNSQAIALIFESLDILLKVFPNLLQSNIQYAYYLAQLISLLTWVIFTFYISNNERFLDLKIQQTYLSDLINIKQILEIECKSNIYLSHIEFELFVIESVIFTTPTNSKEGQEIIIQFLGGALKAAFTFSLNNDLIESLKKGVTFLYKECEKYSQFQKLQIIYSLNDFKYSVLDYIEQGTSAQEIAQKLEKIYNDIIKESSEWEIWHSWIQLVSSIFQSKPLFPKLNLEQELRQEIQTKDFLYENFDKTHFLNLKYQNFQNDKQAKKLLDNSQILQEIIILQQILLSGRSNLQSYEQQYFFKLKIQPDSNSQELVVTPTQISQLISLIRQTQNIQNQIIDATKKQELVDQQKIKSAEKLLKDYQNMVVQIIFQLSHLEQLSNEINQDQNQNQINFEEYDQIQASIAQNYLNGLYANNQSQQFQDLFPSKRYFDQIEKIFQRSENQQKFSQVLIEFKQSNNPKQDQIKNLQETMKKLTFISKESKIYSNQNSIYGLNLALSQIQDCKPILTWNLQNSVNLQINLKMLQLEKQSESDSNLHDQIPQLTEKMIQYMTIEKSIEFLYQQYDSCVTYKLLKNTTENQSKIDKLLQTLIIDKINSINLVNQILVQNLFKNLSQDADLNFDIEILKMIKEQLENTIVYVAQVQSALKMITDYINYENEVNNDEKNNQEILISRGCFEDIKASLELSDKQIQFSFEKKFQQLSIYKDKFFTVFLQSEEQIKQNDQQIFELLQQKKQKIENLAELMQAFLKIYVTSDQDKRILIQLKEDIKNILEEILSLDFQSVDSSFTQQNESSRIDSYFFTKINEVLEDIRLNQNDQLEKVNFLDEKTNNLLKQIENLRTLRKIKISFEKYLPLLNEAQNVISNVFQEFQNQSISIEIDLEKIQKHLLNKVDLRNKKEIESQVYFVLCQIESKEEKLYHVEEKIDEIQEKIFDFLDRNKWRIRQAIIFELLQMRQFCLAHNQFNIISGLLVKFQIFETDKRVRMLFENQKGQELSQLMSKSWQSQEQQIQNKLKEKMKELNDISKQILVETQAQMKIKLKKEYTALEKEIQGILENIENISNQLGITVLFFQDIKQDLLRIENKMNQISETVDNINKDMQFLKGRSVKEMLEIRMQKVLQQRLIHNSDNVYIQTSTREKMIQEGVEDSESVLFTEDIFGNGEVNEFIWKQQKDSLLIHGLAGSGKSTAARKIEEFLWLIYQKNRNQVDYIPLIPIFVSLPQLKDPVYCAIEETLKSDNYRFTDRQIDEFKEEVEQKKFRLILIFDSYDELKQQYIGLNLNISNRISKWRSQNDKNKYPKVITTSRSELFTINGYSTWFLSEASQIKFYKEVRLLKFSQDQVREYIKEYTFLCMKRVIKEFYFQFYQEQNYQDFENFYQDVIKSLKFTQTQQSANQMLNDEQIATLISKCQVFISPEDQKTMQQMLIELWPRSKYEEFIKIMQLESVIETPFMVEIVMAVLPYIVKQRQEINNIKENFIRKFVYLSRRDETLQKQALDEWQIIVNNQQFINEFKYEFQVIEQEKKILQYLKNNQKLQIIKRALILEPLSSYDFYVQFFEHYFKRQIAKLREQGEQIDFDQIGNELWEFSHQLANEMTFRNLSQVPYQPSGLVFKKEEEDWRDVFFNDEGQKGVYRRLFRKCIPIKQKGGIYSFNHKSLQEFLVAKWFFEMFQSLQIEDEDRQSNQNIQINQHKTQEIILKSKFSQKSWDFDYMNGPIRFIIDKVRFNEEFKEKLLKLVFQSSKDDKFITASSNSLFLLNLLGQQFIDIDFKKLKIKEVSLNNANFFGCDFSQTSFINVKFQGVNLNHAKITNAKWEQISIDELPKLETKMKTIDQIIYYKKKEIIFVLDGEQFKQYNIYNLKEEKHLNIIISKPTLCVVSNDQKILALLNKNYEIILFDLEQNDQIQKLNFDGCFSQSKDALCFTPDNQSILLGGSDGVDQLNIQVKYEVQVKKQQIESQKRKIQPKSKGKMNKFEQETEFNDYDEDNISGQKDNQKILKQQDLNLAYDKFQSITSDNVIYLKCAKFVVMMGNYSFTLYYPNESQEKKLKVIQYKFKKLICLDINKDSNIIATGGDSGEINLYNISQLDQPIGLQGHKDHVSQIQFSSNGQKLASCSWDKTIRLWNVQQQSQLFQTNFVIQNRIKSLCLVDDITDNNETLLTFTGFQDGLIQLWDLDGVQSKPNTSKGHQNLISCAIFSYDGEYIISGSYDKLIKIWSTTTGQQIGQDLSKHTNFVKSLAISDDSNLLCSGSTDGYIYLWDFRNQIFKDQINLFQTEIYDIKILKDNNNENRIVSLTNEKIIQIWSSDLNESYVLYDYDDENERKIPQQESNEILYKAKDLQVDVAQDLNIQNVFYREQQIITAIETSLDNKTTIIGTDKGSILLKQWDGETFTKDSYNKTSIQNIKTINHKNFLIVKQNQVFIYQFQDLIEKDSFYLNHNINPLELKIFGDLLFTAQFYIEIWNISQKPKYLKSIEKKDYFTAVTFNQKTNIIYGGQTNGNITIIDFQTEAHKIIEQAHEGEIIRIEYLQKTQQLISCDQIQIKLWDQEKNETEENFKILNSFKQNKIIKCDYQIVNIFLHPEEIYFILQLQNQMSIWDINNYKLVENLINIQKNTYVTPQFKKQQVLWTDKNFVLTLPVMNKKIKYSYMQKKRNHFPEALVVTENQMIITSDFHGSLWFWDNEGRNIKKQLRQNKKELKQIQLSKDQSLIIQSFRHSIQIVNIEKMEVTFSKDLLEQEILNCHFLEENQILLASNTKDKQLEIISLNQNNEIQTKNEHVSQICGISVNFQKQLFLSYGADKAIRLYVKIDKDYSCKFNYSSLQKFECQGAKIKDFTIKSKSKIDLLELFQQKMAIIEK